jgi:hypothetical protein
MRYSLATMNILKTLLSKIIGSKSADASGQTIIPPAPAHESPTVALQQPSSAVEANAAQVDINKTLSELASKSNAQLNWRTSIVDLMKLVGMDSSLTARKELAAELGYAGDTNDSATMNMWLHKQVMKKLADNGGIVPPELL